MNKRVNSRSLTQKSSSGVVGRAVATGRYTVVRRTELGSVSETAYLLGTQTNADRLRRSAENARAGRVEEHDLP